MFYVSRGNVPHTRHVQHRSADGDLYAEELFGVEGFTGRSSLLYHVVPPTRVTRIEPLGPVTVETADDGSHHHQLIDTAGLQPSGDAVSGRIPLFHNADVVFGVVLPATAMPPDTFYRNGEGDELLFVHEGTARCGRTSVTSPTTRRLPRPADRTTGAWTRRGNEPGCCTECPSEIERRSATARLRHSCSSAPFSADIRIPSSGSANEPAMASSSGRAAVTPRPLREPPVLRRGLGRLTVAERSTTDFQPITGRVHQPPPVHQTFAARTCGQLVRAPQVRLSPHASPRRCNHTTSNSDEVHLLRRRQLHEPPGVGIASYTLHPAGNPHGPHPGTVEASIARRRRNSWR